MLFRCRKSARLKGSRSGRNTGHIKHITDFDTGDWSLSLASS